MKIKKSVKKLVSKIFPDGTIKEKIKCIWYNTLEKSNIKFDIAKDKRGSRIYKTEYNHLTFFTNQPLYSLVRDFDNYQYLYKVKPGDVVIDAGANMGILTLLFLKLVNNEGHVHAFEPDKYNVELLNNNLELNEVPNNISLHSDLIWSKNTEVDFDESGTVASSALWFSENNNIVKKSAITLDSWAKENKIGKLDFIKMDIEGAEIEAIKGCKDIIKTFKPNFAIASYHILNGKPTYLSLEKFFEAISYPFKTIHLDGYEIITFAGPCVGQQN